MFSEFHEVGVFDDKVALQMNELVDDENCIVKRIVYMPGYGGGQGCYVNKNDGQVIGILAFPFWIIGIIEDERAGGLE